MTEAAYQRKLIRKLERLFPGCILLKQDANYRQGILDWLLLFEDTWAALEIKASRSASHRPNQDYYVDQMNDMSFAAFIYPEIEEEVLIALQQAFASRRAACLPQP